MSFENCLHRFAQRFHHLYCACFFLILRVSELREFCCNCFTTRPCDTIRLHKTYYAYFLYIYEVFRLSLSHIFFFSTTPQCLGNTCDQLMQFYQQLLPSLERYRDLLNNPETSVSIEKKSWPINIFIHSVQLKIRIFSFIYSIHSL